MGVIKISEYLEKKEGPIEADTLEEAISKILKRHHGVEVSPNDINLQSRYTNTDDIGGEDV